MKQIRSSSPEIIVVGFADASRSSFALRWAIRRAHTTGATLRVVHASAFPLTAHDGPAASGAQQLGNPSWAALHSTVAAFSPPADVHTVADQGSPMNVLLRWSQDASLVVLGKSAERASRRSLKRRLQARLDIPVVDITDADLDLRPNPVAGPSEQRPSGINQAGKVNS